MRYEDAISQLDPSRLVEFALDVVAPLDQIQLGACPGSAVLAQACTAARAFLADPTELNGQKCQQASRAINDLMPTYAPTHYFPTHAANEARQAVEWVLDAIRLPGPHAPEPWADSPAAQVALATERAAISRAFTVNTDDFDVYAAAERAAYADQMLILANYFGMSLTHQQAEVVYALLDDYEGAFTDLLVATPAALA